jgi:hypothetical protein
VRTEVCPKAGIATTKKNKEITPRKALLRLQGR